MRSKQAKEEVLALVRDRVPLIKQMSESSSELIKRNVEFHKEYLNEKFPGLLSKSNFVHRISMSNVPDKTEAEVEVMLKNPDIKISFIVFDDRDNTFTFFSE